eukprot:s1542_g14.t1
MPASRHLQELVADAARAIGRSVDDVRPFLKLLEENWFDTVESVRTLGAKELQDLGIPLRFARELVLLAQRGGSGSGSGSGSSLPPPPAPAPAAPAVPAVLVPAPAAAGVGSGRSPLAPPAPARTVPPRHGTAAAVPPPQRGQPVPLPKQQPRQPSKGKGEGTGGDQSHKDWNDWRNEKNDWERPERTEKGKNSHSSGKGKRPETKTGKGSTSEWDAWQSAQSAQSPKGKGKGYEEDWQQHGHGKGRREHRGWEHYQREFSENAKGQSKHNAHAPSLHTHKIFLDIEDPDPSFGLNGRLIGQNGQNVKHIREITGATVNLAGQGSGEGSSNEQLHVLLQSQDAQTLDEAIRVTNDLIDTVLDQYATFQAEKGDSLKGSGKQTGANKKTCHNCGERGHFAIRCPKPKHQNQFEEQNAKRIRH